MKKSKNTRNRVHPDLGTRIGGQPVAEASAKDLKHKGERAKKSLPLPPTPDSGIPPRRPLKSSPGGRAPGAGVADVKTPTPPGEGGHNPLQTVEVRDTYRLRKKGGVVRLQRVEGHKRSLTRKRLKREGKI